MKIIGHRGAAGLAPENTLAAIAKSLEYAVDAIEVDVRMTSDGELVLLHDASLLRTTGQNLLVAEITYEQLSHVRIHGETIPTLRQALQAVGTTPFIIELKVTDCLDKLLKVLADFPDANVRIASFHLDVLSRLHERRPELQLYVGHRTNPFEIIYQAKAVGAVGLDLNAWILNPLSYLMARQAGLDVFVYTVNSRLIARWLGFFYPSVNICTNYPNRFKAKAFHR